MEAFLDTILEQQLLNGQKLVERIATVLKSTAQVVVERRVTLVGALNAVNLLGYKLVLPTLLLLLVFLVHNPVVGAFGLLIRMED